MNRLEYNAERHAKTLILSSGVCQRVYLDQCINCFMQTAFNLNNTRTLCTNELAYQYAVKFLNRQPSMKSIW